MGLAGEEDPDRALLPPQELGQPIEVREEQPGSLVGRESPGEADGQDVGIEGGLDRVKRRRRLAVTGELAAQSAPGEDRELELLALVGLPQILGRDLGEVLPERSHLALLVEVVELS